MLEHWEDYITPILTFESGVVATLVFFYLVIRHFTRQQRLDTKARKRLLQDATLKACEFASEVDATKGAFIDNNVVSRWQKTYGPAFKVLDDLKKHVNRKILPTCNLYRTLRDSVDEWNQKFIQEESIRRDKFFGRLDERQREACIADETATLVIAGAGSGKTSTIEKKVEYLILHKGIQPEDILLLSFTNKAADEMTERLSKSIPEARMSASTFHKFGLSIVKTTRIGNYDIADPHLCTNTVLHDISPETMTDDECRGLLRFFAFCLNAEPSDLNKFSSFGDYINNTRHCDFKTLKSLSDTSPHTKTTFNGEQVKSLEELEIANWLYLNGIQYEYERKYDAPVPKTQGNKFRVYKPDFYLPDYKIWIEHFGVDKNGDPPKFFSDAERRTYKAGMQWKRQLHTANKTTLVESYSWWHFEGNLTDNLWEALRIHGVRRKGIDPKPVWNKLLESPQAEKIREFAKLVSTFISLSKSNGLKSESIDEVLTHCQFDGLAQKRTREFLDQVRPFYRKYEEKLSETNAIDFHDMINEATARIEETASCVHPYKYIIIDEFQDISAGRAKLIKALIAATNAKLFCVGDDWQSIYRFAGSDITIFTHFAEHFGFTRTIKLENTYRNSAELLSIAGSFIMKNRQQITKDLRSSHHCERPVSCIPYGETTDIVNALHVALAKIAEETQGRQATVFLLGRHNFEVRSVLDAKDMTADERRETFVWEPHPELHIKFMTVHKSKGLEADYVVLLNFRNDLLGFPNSISDDPVLALLLSDKEEVAFAEERRVFYVALTRTKNKIYILTPTQSASVFLDDLPKDALISADSTNSTVYCPKCRTGHLILRKSKSDESHLFYGCSNYPRCDYTLPLQRVAITPETPRCTCGGFLVPVHNPHNGEDFIGCTEFARLQPYRHIQHALHDQSNATQTAVIV